MAALQSRSEGARRSALRQAISIFTRAIVAFIDLFLKPGGLVYGSYNCMPGWAAMAPFQRLLVEHAKRNPNRNQCWPELSRQGPGLFEWITGRVCCAAG